ncbi:hypothetical protein QQF64_006747 [Cirrhinus molitorella]|uniref:Uncharacterized protein n=1 Tax=Cirrhinus molitorella TaxID=172907 RepID=A0ABR3M8Q4_9TELE
MSLDMIGSRPSVACPDWLPHRSHGSDWSHSRCMFYPNPGHIQGTLAFKAGDARQMKAPVERLRRGWLS